MLDFFLPEAEKEYEKYVNKGGSSSEKPGSPKTSATGSIATLFSGLQPILNQELAENINALYKFELSGWLWILKSKLKWILICLGLKICKILLEFLQSKNHFFWI